MRELYFGGSFNPIHLGHLRASAAVARAEGFLRVVLVPAAVSPHKLMDADYAPAEHRLAMCQLAANSADADGPFAVDDLELCRPFPSYTIDTVRALRVRSPGDPVHWLIGADQVAKLPFWHESNQLVREAQLLIMARPGFEFDFEGLPEPFRSLKNSVVEAPLIDVGATEIRRRVRLGLSIDKLVPAEVADYIAANGLYRGTNLPE